MEDQDGRGHEEVYVVLRGAARFTVDGERIDGRAGTFVRVAPAVRRHAVALEPDTAVLALGGDPGYEPSASEWIERARPHIRSDPARAAAVVDELRAAQLAGSGLEVAQALLALGRGEVEHARALLAKLLRRVPENSAVLSADPDLGPLLRGPDDA